MSDRVPLQESQPESKESVTEDSPQPDTAFKEALGYMDDIDYHRMADFMGVSYDDRKDVAVAEKLSFLYDWAQNRTGSSDRIDNYSLLKQVWRGLGMNEVGAPMIRGLYKWARLDARRRKIERQMKVVSIDGV